MPSDNMYRVGDCVYFEENNFAPYNVRRIEELTKNQHTGSVEAKVVIFYRRRDIPIALLKIADQAVRNFGTECIESPENGSLKPAEPNTKMNGQLFEKTFTDEDIKEDLNNPKKNTGLVDYGMAGLPFSAEKLTDHSRYRLRGKELFLSRQTETLPASQIRGKCVVTLLSDVEGPDSYLAEDTFFYSLVYEPNNGTLLADKGSIRQGHKYQAVVPEGLEEDEKPESPVSADADENKENGELIIDEDEVSSDVKDIKPIISPLDGGEITTTERETLVWHPYHTLSDQDIDRFLIMARSIGTFARALDTSSSTKLPSLHMTAASASRDVTIFHALALLHQANYNLSRGMAYLVPTANKNQYPFDVDKSTGHNTINLGGPVLVRDQMEEWSAAEANLFEEALERCGKDFTDIHLDFLGWKSIRDIVEYYYMWKTTNRYIDGRKKKLMEEKEKKLRQVYIPQFNPGPNFYAAVTGTDACVGCKAEESSTWYAWGPHGAGHRICINCHRYWKKFAGLTNKNADDMFDMTDIGENSTLTERQLRAKRTEQRDLMGRGCQQIVARMPITGHHTLPHIHHHHHHHNSRENSTSHPTGKSQPKQFSFYATQMNKVVRKLAPKSIVKTRKMARCPWTTFDNIELGKHVNTIDFVKIFEVAKIVGGDKVTQSVHQYLLQRTGAASNDTKPNIGIVSPQKRPATDDLSALQPSIKRTGAIGLPTAAIPEVDMGLSIAAVPPIISSVAADSTTPAQHRDVYRFFAGVSFRRRRSDILPRSQARRVARSPFHKKFELLMQSSLNSLIQFYKQNNNIPLVAL